MQECCVRPALWAGGETNDRRVEVTVETFARERLTFNVEHPTSK